LRPDGSVMDRRRAFTGAWIETIQRSMTLMQWAGRAFTGAWIETPAHIRQRLTLAGRAFTGAWIETRLIKPEQQRSTVAPSRARGLKPRLPAGIR